MFTDLRPPSWYDNPEYSDITIKLSSGREIRLHKHVLCTANEWFNKACGTSSHFAVRRPLTCLPTSITQLTASSQESKQDTIELKDDNPDALDLVLRYIYTIQPCVVRSSELAQQAPWRFWLDVHTTADKCLIPQLSKQAYKRFFDVARSRSILDEIIDIIETLTTELSHDDGLVKLLDELREAKMKRLLQSARYREKLESDKALLWEHVDQLLAADHAAGGDRGFFLAPAQRTRRFHITNDSDAETKVYFRYEGSLTVEGDFGF